MRAIACVLGLAAASVCSDTGALELDLEFPMRASRYTEVVRRAEPAQGDPRSLGISRLVYLCYAYSRLKEYTKLSRCLDAAAESIGKGDIRAAWPLLPFELDMTPFPHWLRAEAAIDFGSYEEAAREAAKAHDAVAQKDLSRSWRVHALSVLGLAEALRGNRDLARKHAEALADIYTGYPFGQLAGDKWIGTAKIYMALRSYKESLEAVRRHESEGALIRTLGNALLGGQALVYQEVPAAFIAYKSLYEIGNVEEAREGYDTLLKMSAVQWNGELYWVLLFDRGRLAEADKNPAEAIRLYQQAVEVIERQRATINTEASRIGFVGNKQQVYERLIALLLQQGRVDDAFDYVERSKARALVDMLASKKDFAGGAAADADKARAILARLESADAASRLQPPDAEAKDGATRSLALARSEIAQVAPELATLVTVTSVPARELRELMAEREALVVYYYQESDLYAFVLRRDGLSAIKLGAAGLADAVQAFRSAIQNPASDTWRESARSLRERLWTPLQPALGTRDVIIVPHGALHYLPFAALLAEDGKALVDEFNLRFLPSASVLKYLKAAPPPGDALMLALGNPDLNDTRLDLKHAEEEARALGKLFPKSRVLVRRDASESNFKDASSLFWRIHFATHGKFHAETPLQSGLYLASDGRNDGVLTVGELYSMRLQADLVTLSACETGLGKVANGDDVVGLTRGFLYAGSRSIVASLWSVDDRATAALMQAFYEGLTRASKTEALRSAQIRARQDFPHPFFWAAFQLTGRPD